MNKTINPPAKTEEIAIRVENVNKTFKLPHEKQSSIKGLFVNMFRRNRTYEKQHVLKDITFEIKKGEFFGIVGRNGSGKSTLLKLLAGIYTPDSGDIQVNGKLTPFIELGVGFNPELTGRENVFLNGALLGFNRKEMDAMYDEIVDFAELEKFMDQKLKNYSSGMQVRLAFSIAIRAKSDVLLIDEVLAVGDVLFQRKCYKFFETLKQSDQTVVFISHDASAVERFCDRVAVVDKGRIRKIGSPKAALATYLNTINKERANIEKTLKKSDHDQYVAEVKDIRIFGKSGKRLDTVQFGEPFSLDIAYATPAGIDEVIVGVAIMDDKNRNIIGPNTREIGKKVSLKKRGSIIVGFPSLPLAAGEYSITVGIFNKDETFSYVLKEEAARLIVEGPARHGVLDVIPTWKEV